MICHLWLIVWAYHTARIVQPRRMCCRNIQVLWWLKGKFIIGWNIMRSLRWVSGKNCCLRRLWWSNWRVWSILEGLLRTVVAPKNAALVLFHIFEFIILVLFLCSQQVPSRLRLRHLLLYLSLTLIILFCRRIITVLCYLLLNLRRSLCILFPICISFIGIQDFERVFRVLLALVFIIVCITIFFACAWVIILLRVLSILLLSLLSLSFLLFPLLSFLFHFCLHFFGLFFCFLALVLNAFLEFAHFLGKLIAHLFDGISATSSRLGSSLVSLSKLPCTCQQVVSSVIQLLTLFNDFIGPLVPLLCQLFVLRWIFLWLGKHFGNLFLPYYISTL